jgi:hypothetical protein
MRRQNSIRAFVHIAPLLQTPVLQAQPTVAWASQRILSDSNAGFTALALGFLPGSR